MTLPSEIIIASTAKELGKLARSNRKAAGMSLRQTSALNNLGVRFLSEFERGKPTAEIGKVITALQAAGLDLAVVPRPNIFKANVFSTATAKEATVKKAKRLSQRLNLEFPYEWSNPDLDESTFIHLVLEKTRFNDILRIAHYFGIERIESESRYFVAAPQERVINKLLARIRTGIERAQNASAI